MSRIFNFRPQAVTFWRSGSSTETTSKQESRGKDGNEPSEDKESSKANDAAISQEDNKMAEENSKLQAALKEFEVKTYTKFYFNSYTVTIEYIYIFCVF